MRKLMAVHTRSADMIRIGAYKPGMDVELDRSIQAMPALRNFLEQRTEESGTFEQILVRFQGLAI